MKVRILEPLANASGGFAPGEVVDLEDAQAASWLAAGVAEPVGKAATIETAATGAQEAAVAPRARKPRASK